MHSVEIERGSPPFIDLLRQGENVFLSPHYDDAAFSMGVTIREIGRGTLINLFTRSLNLPNRELAQARAWTLDEISAVRDTEDSRFAALCGLKRRNLDLEEPPVRGRHAKDIGGLAEDCSQLRKPLADALAQVIAEAGPTGVNLFCPAAIGGHVNHTATMLTLSEMLPTLRVGVKVFFYEDLPYASSFWRRQIGIARLKRILPSRHAVRHILWLGDRAAAKLGMVAGYVSQHRHPPRASRYTPHALALRPHEAFWTLRH